MLSKPAFISIIMPCFNRGYMIMDAVTSVLDQTDPDWELIVVDDGSTDNTKAIVDGIDDPRVHYYRQVNQGPSAARNTGVALARSDWVAYLDSDDTLYPNYVAVMKAQLRSNPRTCFAIVRAHRTFSLYESDQRITSFDNSDDLPAHVSIKDIFMKRFHFCSNGFTHKRELFNKQVHWDETLRHMEEWDLAMMIGERHPNGFLYVPIELCTYEQRHGLDGICSHTAYSDWARAFRYIYRKHKNDSLLADQTWYPERVEKWNKIDADYKKGLLPPPHLYFFPEYFQPTPLDAVAA